MWWRGVCTFREEKNLVEGDGGYPGQVYAGGISKHAVERCSGTWDAHAWLGCGRLANPHLRQLRPCLAAKASACLSLTQNICCSMWNYAITII